jgi:hypothetical protein
VKLALALREPQGEREGRSWTQETRSESSFDRLRTNGVTPWSTGRSAIPQLRRGGRARRR